MQVIDSIKDDRIVAARALATRAGRESAGRCLLEGGRLIGQALRAGVTIDFVLHAGDGPASAAASDRAGDLDRDLRAAGVPVFAVRGTLLRKVTGSAKPVDQLAVAQLPADAGSQPPYGDFVVVCDGVADPGNIGTIARTARALGVTDLVFTEAGTDYTTRRVLEASRGAILTSRIRRFDSAAAALGHLKAAGFLVVVTSPHASHPQATAPLAGHRIALVVGNETDGVSAQSLAAADLTARIPMAGAVESLNVGVATGIGIYELRMRMILAMLTDRIRNTLGRNLNVAGTLARRAFDTALAPAGDLDSDQAVALMVLACERRTTLAQLGRDLGLPVAEVTGVLAEPGRRGYVNVDGDVALITAPGEQAIAALWLVQERVEEQLYAGFSAAERDQLQDLLQRVQRNAAASLPTATTGSPVE